jgi:glycosyltransferase involved in cell wall biosynthesis
MTHKTDCLRVYETSHGLRRFGRDLDGGYVIATLPVKYDYFLSGGIGNDNKFEIDLLDAYPDMHCQAYDIVRQDFENYTRDHDRFHFHLESVPLLTTQGKNALVKIDIEGDEWDFFLHSDLRNIAQLTCELHWMGGSKWNWKALEKLAETHVVIWAHANNGDSFVDIDGVQVPQALELTWVRRDLAGDIRPSRRKIPCSLDRSNGPEKQDMEITWPPFVHGSPTPEPIDFVPYVPMQGFVPPEVLPVLKATPPVEAPAVVKSSKKMAFLLDPWAAPRPINPEHCFTDSRGLTGSEITCLMQAIEMAKLGHDVTFYSNVTENREAHGIKFAKWDRWEKEAKTGGWHSAFATISPLGMQHLPAGVLRVFNQQVNDFGYCRGWEQCTDIVTALAETHKKHLSQFTTFKEWRILPNGCDPSAFQEGDRNNKKLVFASSPDRGLHWLLELFPRLKKRVPDVECHIYYNFQENAVQAYTNIGEHEMANRFKYINMALAKLQNRGVFHHKNVSRQEIARVFSNSRILAYTCDPVRFTEGFSCTTLEAAVAGCLPVICGADALGEIYSNFVPVTPPPYKDHRDHYFENLLKYLTDDGAYREAQTKAKAMAETHNWTAVAKKLQSILGLSNSDQPDYFRPGYDDQADLVDLNEYTVVG